MDLIRKSWTKIAAGLLLVGALGAGGKATYDRYFGSCCYEGSPCCTGGSCCMRNGEPAKS